jgi:peptidoglycan/LPS O-acetylase OafA/YrhL
MESTKQSTKTDQLRPVRFVVYITTIIYAGINAISGPGSPPDNDTIFSTVFAATIVGVIQLVAAIVGITFDLTDHAHRVSLKAVLLVLCLCYIYEALLVMTSTVDPFSFIPLLVYSALSAVLYLSKD